jgi:Ala-tRNA(Pro) deacylase
VSAPRLGRPEAHALRPRPARPQPLRAARARTASKRLDRAAQRLLEPQWRRGARAPSSGARARTGEEEFMAVSQRLRRLLTGEYASYRFVTHGARSSARDVADAAKVPARQFAKVVVFRDAAGVYVMVVVPSTTRVRLDSVERTTGRPGLRLATEDELQALFPDCDVGAMPPFGGLYGLPVYVDACFREQPEFFFRGGAHDEVVGMLFADYESLVRPVYGQWCFHDAPRRRPVSAPRPAAAPA